MRKVSISTAASGVLVGLLTLGMLSARADHAKGHSQQWDDRSSIKIEDPSPPVEKARQAPPASRPMPPSRGGRARPSKRTPTPPDGFPSDSTSDPLPDRDAVRRGARQFQNAVQDGRVHLLNASREGAQLDGLRLDGFYTWPAPPGPSPRYFRADPAGEGDGPVSTDDVDSEFIVPHATSTRAGSVDLRKPVGRGSARQSAQGTDVQQPQLTEPEVVTTAPPIAFFVMLNGLAARSTARSPLEISSLMRPPYRTGQFQHAGITNPHSLGLAADITAFGGHRIRTDDPEECVQALLSLLRALPAGRYRMGLPKAPEPVTIPTLPLDEPGDPALPPNPRGDRTTERSKASLPSRGLRRQDDRLAKRAADTKHKDGNIDARSSPPAQTDTSWPFFPPPQPGIDAKGKPVTLFANEHYADEQFVTDDRIRQAFVDARRRGVDVFALFPDGLNHIHVDVKQIP